jgi:hypothetical protein
MRAASTRSATHAGGGALLASLRAGFAEVEHAEVEHADPTKAWQTFQGCRTMSAAVTLAPPSPKPGMECWRVMTGYGVRRVLLRRFTLTGRAVVCAEARFAGWKTAETVIHPCHLFVSRDAALAKYRLQPRRRLSDHIPGLDAPRATA